MRFYGHLRDQHSAEMATKVTFAPVSKPADKEKPLPESAASTGEHTEAKAL